MADERAGGAAKVALDPEEEWKRAVARRREYTIRNTKAMAAGILVAVVNSAALIGGLFSVMEGDWDGSRPGSMARLLALLATPGVLVGIWVRNKLKVPNS
ncbi:hypothetical protein [Polyangium jinanense]|uniref:Uncharacterized protein n=1 Tax=Polyangium jinanense TaxID=2829994 RepID=A0A9X3X0I1_9BACT|nr:hypothetical protein [Polyangium jinanense]MDC3954792.1 hypothetical protein [Polyangium jinanense]MDC3981437.1 hypothetical protein [Polyangium jinanense]